MLINIEYDTETKMMNMTVDGESVVPDSVEFYKRYEDEMGDDESTKHHFSYRVTEKMGKRTEKMTALYASVAKALLGENNV